MGVSKASLRGLGIHERLEKMREADKALRKTVKVTPTSDVIRKLIRHPQAGGFPKEGAAVWPDDGFTQRREADGDITITRDREVSQQPEPKPEPVPEPVPAAEPETPAEEPETPAE